LKNLRTSFVVVALATGAMGCHAMAGDREVVQSFYDFLSNPASADHAVAMQQTLAEDWTSIGDYSGATKSREKFIGQIGGFGQLIPDMNWSVEEMLQDGNRFIVRGRATGTPNKPLFGVDGKGKRFEIMSIDIHTVEGGRIVNTYHVEDWAGALRQLKAD
jgi:predicted ester cyclase